MASSERARPMALLLVRQVPRDRYGRRFDVHLVNVGKADACAASWRVERIGYGAPFITTILRDLPSAVPAGADLLVASADRDDARQEQVDMIVRWVQPSGAVEESLHRFT